MERGAEKIVATLKCVGGGGGGSLLSSPSYGNFSLRSGENSYALFISALIGRLLSAAGNRLTASLRKETVGAGNQFQLKSRE